MPKLKQPEKPPHSMDDVLRRMLTTPPEPKVKPKGEAKPKKKKPAE